MNEPCQLCQTTTRHACDSLDPNMRTYTNRGAALIAAEILSDDNEPHVAIDGPFDGECTVMTAEQAWDAGFIEEEEGRIVYHYGNSEDEHAIDSITMTRTEAVDAGLIDSDSVFEEENDEYPLLPDSFTYSNQGAAFIAAQLLSDDDEPWTVIDGPWAGEYTTVTAREALQMGFIEEEDSHLLNNIKGLWLGMED